MRFAFALFAIASACAPTLESGGIRVYQDEWNATTHELQFRAVTDFGPCEAREYTLLRKIKRTPVSVGVAGCGASGVYERRRRGVITVKYGASWELVSSAPKAAVRAE